MRRPLDIGRFQTLEIVELVSEGALLGAHGRDLLIPREQLPANALVGQRLRVFIYVDRDGLPQATTTAPAAALGGFARMRCAAITQAGAYMDWGLPKDLYIPPYEQAQRMELGHDYVVTVCLDRRKERLIGSTHLASHFDYDVRAVLEDDEVELLVYGSNDAGIQVVVDQRHRGLVHHSDVYGRMPVGAVRTGYVRQIRDDNRLDIALKPRGKAGMLDAQDTVLQALEAAGGFLPLHDRSDPAEIERALGMSKKAFKRGVGGLYKARRIVLQDGGIALAPADEADEDVSRTPAEATE